MPLKRVKVGDLAHLTECSPSVHMILGDPEREGEESGDTFEKLAKISVCSDC